MSLRGYLAARLESACIGLLARVALWRDTEAPETRADASDLWPEIEARLAPREPVAFCCGRFIADPREAAVHLAFCWPTHDRKGRPPCC